MHLGAEAAARVPQRMFLRLFDLRLLRPGQARHLSGMVFGPRCGPAGPDHGRIDEPKVVTQAAPLLQGVEQGGKDLRPGAVAAPSSEAAVDGFPRAIDFRDVSPGGAGVEAPEDTIEDTV